MSEYTREEILKLIKERSGPEGLDLAGKDLLGIDLSGVDLHGAILARADLREANLKRANLRGADLSWAVLQEADLRWADLRQADLCQADLRKASLRWADLREAEIEGADFTGVDLTEVQLTKIERAVPGYRVSLQQRLRGLAVPRAMVFAMALVVLAYLWGWLYRAFYFDEFGLPWTSLSLLSMDYLLRGWQVIVLSLKFLLMLALLSLYALLTIIVFLLIPLTLIYSLGNRLLSRLGISQMRWGVLSAMFLAYLVIILLLFPSVIAPLWGWLIEKGIPAKEGFQVFQVFLKALSAAERALFLAFLALSLAPLWALYRLLCQRLPEAEVPSSLRSRYPWLDTVLASLKGARPFDLAHPLAPWERYLGLLGAMVVLIAIPTFLTQAGVLHAQSDICYGGPLPQIELYAKGLTTGLLPPTEEATGEPQYCLRLLLAKKGKYYVFYPHQTRGGEGERTPNVYEVPAEEVDIVYRERETCWTCLDEVPAAEGPPVVITSLVTPTATPTSTPTAVPLPPTATPIIIPTSTPLPTATPGPPPPTPTPLPTPTPTRPPCWDDYEPDDAVGQENLIALGETQTHNFCPDDDIDLVTFPVKGRHWYHVYTHDLALGVDTMISVGLVPTIAIYCNPSNCASDDVAPGNLTSDIVFQAAADGSALVTIDNRYQHGPDKTYRITVEEIVPTPTPTPSITPTPTVTRTPTPTPTLVPPKDPWENNNTFGQAYGPLASGQAYEANISSSGDRDYYWIDVPSLELVTILLTDMGEDADYDLYFYNVDLVEMTRSARGAGQDEEIVYHPGVTGKYYILVWSPTGVFDAYDEYKLVATFGPAVTPTPTSTATPTFTPTATSTPTATLTSTSTPEVATETPTPTSTLEVATETPTPTSTPTAEAAMPTATPTSTPTPTATT